MFKLLRKGKNWKLFSRISNQNLLSKFYSIADRFLITSSWENYPTVCVESQCTGTGIFGFDTCGTKESEEFDGTNKTLELKNSNFVQYGDLDALERVVRRMLTTNYNREDLAQRARERFSKETMAEKYIALYKEILDL